jgi:hypothetical protein
MTDTIALLFAPFPDKAISWRVGSTTKDKSRGMALAYIDARDVMRRLDDACGAGGWQCEYVDMSNGTICCRIGVQTPSGEWVWKANGGSATGDVDNEKEREMAEKGGYSDAFKRAAVLWGVGRYLYDIETPWIELEQKGTSHVMKTGERAKLDKAHANFVRNYFRNAAPVDAGQREQPRSQLEAGADEPPKAAAPAQTMSKGDARGDYGVMVEEMRRITSSQELKEWGKMNAERVKLQPTDWRSELRKTYLELEEGLKHNERTSAEAEEAFADAR